MTLDNLPQTQAMVFYAYSIRVGSTEIGTFRQMDVTDPRTAERYRGIQHTGGRTAEVIPGVSSPTLSLQDVSLYSGVILEKLGYDVANIEDITFPFDVVENQEVPNYANVVNPAGNPIERTSIYKDCWITRFSKSINEGTVILIQSIDVEVTRIQRGSFDSALPVGQAG